MPHLPEDMQRTVAARMVAGSVPEAARRLFLSERAFRGHLTQVGDALLVGMGLRRDTAYIAMWFMLHRQCCTATGWDMMETDAVFPTDETSTCASENCLEYASPATRN